MSEQLRILMRKEWRQLLRSRAALATGLLLPILFLLVLPGSQMLAMKAAMATGKLAQMAPPPPTAIKPPPGFADLRTDPSAVVRLLLTVMVTLSALIVPSVSAMYTVLSERESRTLELMVALPVRVEQVLWAKLLVILELALAITGTLVLVDVVALLVLKLASLEFVLALVLLLVAALAYSCASSLLISLLAKDYRTANNITGGLLVPSLFITVAVLAFVPGEVMHTLVLAAVLVAGAGVSVWVALRVITFERLMR